MTDILSLILNLSEFIAGVVVIVFLIVDLIRIERARKNEKE